MLVAALAPFGAAVAVSGFGTLLYYSVTNLSALRLPSEQRRYSRAVPVAGVVGCLGLAAALAPQEIGIGVAIGLVGVTVRLVRLAILGRYQGLLQR